jgi:hypothetical protein
MSKEQTMYCYPQLKEQDLKGSVVYYDGQHNDARKVLSTQRISNYLTFHEIPGPMSALP